MRDGDKMKIRLLHSGAGDWIGLYLDDKLVAEDHNLSEGEMVQYLLPKSDFKDIWSDDEDLEEYGNRCPDIWPEDLG
jgi:hypothetical protein